ncbi:MAG: hypothetical protein K2K69_03475 [Muribaculaceae bacterium]|nr:hypothetical protein [Muribaculaceae bacterium]
MTIAISIDKILDSVFARVALDAVCTGTAPAVGRDELPALRVLARDILRSQIARLGNLVKSADFDSDPEIVHVVLGVDGNSAVAPVAGSVMCSALGLGIMAALHGGTAAEAGFRSGSESELSILLAATEARIVPGV